MSCLHAAASRKTTEQPTVSCLLPPSANRLLLSTLRCYPSQEAQLASSRAAADGLRLASRGLQVQVQEAHGQAEGLRAELVVAAAAAQEAQQQVCVGFAGVHITASSVYTQDAADMSDCANLDRLGPHAFCS